MIRFWSVLCFWVAIGGVCRCTSAADKQLAAATAYPNESAGLEAAPVLTTSGNRGAASCAAAACHGGPNPGHASDRVLRGSEYSLWLERDPHANSWRTLCSELSLQIMTNLGIVESGKITKPAAYGNCLACHNTSSELDADGLTPRLAEGVGCESCHGPSRDWYNLHFRQSPLEIRGNLCGMADLDALVDRARKCASCHVGGPDRDMNHDIIAAGHPALYFDMASYHERYPKHWRSTDDQSPDKRARLWMAGQIAIAEAELELLQARAGRSHTVSTWPELSVFNCTSCHFNLRDRSRDSLREPTSDRAPSHDALALDSRLGPNSRGGAIRQGKTTGRARLRLWNLGGIEAVGKLFPTDVAPDISAKLERLGELVSRPSTDAGSIAQAASDLRQTVVGSVDSAADRDLLAWNQHKQSELATSLLRSETSRIDWESACRAYTATWAALPPHGKTKSVPLAARDVQDSNLAFRQLANDLDVIRQGLLFPVNSQSPEFLIPSRRDVASSLSGWDAARLSAATQLEMVRP